MTAEDLIVRHEGEVLKPYRCPAGKLTIGVGHNLDDNGIPREVSRLLLKLDIAEVERALSGLRYWDGLCEVRQAALVDMCFNLGFPRFMQFQKMHRALEVCDHEAAAQEMTNSRWARQVGKRADTLAAMMKTGRWEES